LRPGALDGGVGSLLLQPVGELPPISRLLGIAVVDVVDVTAQRHHVQVDSRHAVRIRIAKPRGDEGTPVAALGPEAPVAEHIGHQGCKAVGDLLDGETGLPAIEGQAIAGE
jgi:hypothetical protein